MAIYSLRVQTLARSEGRSVVAAAAYRSGTSLADNRLVQDFDFSRKHNGVAHAAILAPDNTPAELLDREALWNAAEKADTRRDSVPAREILVALPHELTDQQRRELVEDFARESLVRRGMIVDVAIHHPGQEGDDRNHHAHVLVTTREVGPDGFGKKNPDWNAKAFVVDVRREWAEVANRYLERHAPHAARISEKSLAEQGVERAPTEHKGPDVTAMERRGERTDRGENNRDIQAENVGREREARRLDKQVADDFDAKKWPPRQTDRIIQEMEASRAGLGRQREAWRLEREAIPAPKVVSVREVEGELTRKEAAAYRQALRREEEAKARAAANGVSLKKIAFWHANPAQAALQQLRGWNADLDRILKARAEADRARKALGERRAWAKSEEGRAHIQNLRQPQIDAAKAAKTEGRTLDRKLARLDKRIAEADRAILDVKVAKRLGHEQLRVPGAIPKAPGEGTANARRYFRFMATTSRVAIDKMPAPERSAALKFVKALAPGAPVPSIKPMSSPNKSGPSKGPEMPDI